MSASRQSYRCAGAVLAVLAVTAVLVFTCGCTQNATTVPGSAPATQYATAPATTAAATPATEEKKMVTFTEKDDGTTGDIAAGTRFAVQLAENPTTGYEWNATVSSGLAILSDDYQVNEHAEGMVGVGGIRTWILQATGSGDQTFHAVYGRSWEPVTGNETAYSLTIRIV